MTLSTNRLVNAALLVLLPTFLSSDHKALSKVRPWPTRDIPYEFHHEISWRKRYLTKSAMNDIHRQSCITFITWTTQSPYLQIVISAKCNNPYGREMSDKNWGILFSRGLDKEECKKKKNIRHQLLRIAGGDTVEEVNRLYNCSNWGARRPRGGVHRIQKVL